MTFVTFEKMGYGYFWLSINCAKAIKLEKGPIQNKTSLSYTVLFIMLIMISNLRFSSMYVYYSIDREGFIERLCENKDKPELKCDGKCMLAKMLQAQTDEDEQPMPMIGWEQNLVFCLDLPEYRLQNASALHNAFFHYFNNYTYHFSDSLNKPPIV